MPTFGEILRAFCQASNDPDRLNKRLSQERLGELIGDVMDDGGVTGAAVSYWESGESKISAEDRNVLLALIQVLHKCDGLRTLSEANHLLELGNYRPLNDSEVGLIFTVVPEIEPTQIKEDTPNPKIPSLLENLFSASEEELKTLIAKAQEGPEPAWPRVLTALMRKATDRISISFKTLLWVWVWLIAWWLISPSLRLPLRGQHEILLAMQSYVIGSLVVPLLIGALVDTKNNEYWKNQTGVNPFLLRLYTYQGAGIGFNLGYFFIFPLSLVMYYLHFEYSVWIEVLAATAGLILGSLGARVVPHNLWLAYKRLKFSDGGIFFVVALMGPLWGFFLLEFYSVLVVPIWGTLVILVVATILVVKDAWEKRR